MPSASLPPALVVTPLAARRFMRRAVGLDVPFADIASALAHHGYIQIDPINVCGRMHDLILRNRVAAYREGDLMRFLHGPDATPLHATARSAFEHHLPDTGILVALPFEAWPHLQAEMRARTRRTSAWSGRLTPRERLLAPQLLAEIAARGPLGSEDFDDDRRAHRSVWGASSLVKSTLQKLFFHGRLLIAQRTANRRRYDLPERVLPAAILALPAPSPAATARWLTLLKLRQRRLTPLKRTELPYVADAIQPVSVPGCPPLYVLREDVPLLKTIMAEANTTPSPAHPAATELQTPNLKLPTPSLSESPSPNYDLRLLAPLDPLIYERRVTAALWGYDYTWEVYTPAARRVRGYYALPILAGTDLVGHVDPKADRPSRRLTIISRRLRRGHSLRETLRTFATFLGLRR